MLEGPNVMTLDQLETIAGAFSRHWSLDTCDTCDIADWHPGNPSRGQCGVSALIIQEILGGELLVAEVLFASGDPQGVHYWNRLPNGVEWDLTRQQFLDGEAIQEPTSVVRIRRIPNRLADRYERLRSAVLADLRIGESELAMTWPDPVPSG
jgi:hypothetical protein